MLLLALTDVAQAKASVGISPGSFEFSLPPGGEVKGTFVVSNEGDEFLDRVLVYGTNVKPDKKGNIKYTIPGPQENPLNSPASWLTIKVPDPTKIWSNFPYVDLKPGEKKTVDFTLKVPQSAVPGDYTSVVFFEIRKEKKVGKKGVLTGARVGCRIHIRVQGEVLERILLQPFSVKGLVIGNKLPYYFRVKNEGNIDAPTKITLSILTPSEKELKKVTIEKNGYLFARSEREYSGVLKVNNVGWGKRLARVTLTYESADGNFKVIEKDRAFFALPYSFFALLVFFLILAVLAFFFYLDKKFRRKKAVFEEASSEQQSK